MDALDVLLYIIYLYFMYCQAIWIKKKIFDKYFTDNQVQLSNDATNYENDQDISVVDNRTSYDEKTDFNNEFKCENIASNSTSL